MDITLSIIQEYIDKGWITYYKEPEFLDWLGHDILPGWYWIDETENFGSLQPLDTAVEAVKASMEYSRLLDGETK